MNFFSKLYGQAVSQSALNCSCKKDGIVLVLFVFRLNDLNEI